MLMAMVMACALPSGGPSWDPVDVTALRATLADPTASEADALAWVLSSPDALAALTSAGGALTAAVGAIAAPSDTPPVERDTGELSGTEVFVQVTCDRPDGFVEIESPILQLAQLRSIGVQGDLLMTAVSCVQDGDEIDGVAAAWYDAPSESLLVDGAVTVTVSAAGAEQQELPLRAELAGQWGFVVALDSGATLSADFDPERLDAVTVRYDGGALGCDLSAGPACERLR